MDNNEKEIAAIWEPIDILVPWDQNPRYNQSAIQSVADSIKRFGFGAPIIARKEDKMVIAGHTRLEAAKRLELEKVPVRYLDLDPADAKMLALADNKIGEISEWNDELLEQIIEELDLSANDLQNIGWSKKDVENLFESIDEMQDYSEADIDYVYQVVIEDLDSESQAVLIERLEKEGFKCRALTV